MVSETRPNAVALSIAATLANLSGTLATLAVRIAADPTREQWRRIDEEIVDVSRMLHRENIKVISEGYGVQSDVRRTKEIAKDVLASIEDVKRTWVAERDARAAASSGEVLTGANPKGDARLLADLTETTDHPRENDTYGVGIPCAGHSGREADLGSEGARPVGGVLDVEG